MCFTFKNHKLSKPANHITAGDNDSVGLTNVEWNVYVCVCCTQQCICISSVFLCADLRGKLCRTASTVQLFPMAALHQRTLVKPWNWISWLWKNLRQDNYNLSKHQAHACSSLPCSGFWPSTVDMWGRQRHRFHVVTPRKKILVYYDLIRDAHLFPSRDISLWCHSLTHISKRRLCSVF